MNSLSREFLSRLVITPELVQIIRQLGEHKGRQDLVHLQSPEKLDNLRQVAIVQSVESSNRIEGVTASKERLTAIVRDQMTPQNRSEGEIAGYRDVLATIHAHAADISFTDSVVLQLHRDLMQYGSGSGGSWKTTQNEIEETRADGSRFIRFIPTPPYQTADAMRQLHENFRQALKDGVHDPLVLIALYILDFLCIHPFLDGNGRMSRLLSVLALYHHGYEVGRYISLERIIEQTKESYYETLFVSSQGWHDGRHQVIPWMSYWLGTVLAAYRELQHRVDSVVTGHGAKADVVIAAIDSMVTSFTLAELQAACPSVGRDWIRALLAQLKRDGRLIVEGRGRGAKWRKV
jgi:Fic family protein